MAIARTRLDEMLETACDYDKLCIYSPETMIVGLDPAMIWNLMIRTSGTDDTRVLLSRIQAVLGEGAVSDEEWMGDLLAALARADLEDTMQADADGDIIMEGGVAAPTVVPVASPAAEPQSWYVCVDCNTSSVAVWRLRRPSLLQLFCRVC